MNILVIYDSKFGNTAKIADAIARGAGTVAGVTVLNAGDPATSLPGDADLLLVGGPTQRRTMSPGLRALLDSLTPQSVAGVATASFDTRYRGATWLMGSAAIEATKRLEELGARPVARPESFFISRSGPMERQGLEPGELERAVQWGQAVATALPSAAAH
jgi:flavodoxin